MHQPPSRQVLYRGEWLSIPEIAVAIGKSVRTVHRRLQLNMPLDETPLHGRRPKRYAFRGKLATVKEIMAATGLSRRAAEKRTDNIRFYEDHELQHMPSEPRVDSTLIFFNGVTDSVSGWARRLGMNQMTLYTRLKCGWTIKDAIMKPLNTYGKRYTFKGITDTLGGWSKRTGICLATLRERIYMDWPIEAALTVPPVHPALHARRRKALRRLLEGFHAPSSPAVTLPSPPTTGGASKTFKQSSPTGDDSQKNAFVI